MRIHLLTPNGGGDYFRIKLKLAKDHPASHYGLGVLCDDRGTVLSGATLRQYRSFGGMLNTDSPSTAAAARLAMGLPPDEPLEPGAAAGTLGQRIRELRIAAGMKQIDLAGRLGCGNSRVGEWETAGHVPAADTLIRIAAALGVSLSAFDGVKV